MGDDLNKRIAEAQHKLDARNKPAEMSAGKGMGIGMRMATDFVAAVIVGMVLGWGVDAVFHVSPWGMIACLLLGFVTGVRNVVRQAMAAQSGAGNTEDGPGSGDDRAAKRNDDA